MKDFFKLIVYLIAFYLGYNGPANSGPFSIPFFSGLLICIFPYFAFKLGLRIIPFIDDE